MIKIRISGEYAKAAAQTLSETLWFPQAQNDDKGPVFTMENGDAELRLGVSAQQFRMVAEALEPLIKTDQNPDGIFSPHAVWANPTLELKAL